MTKILLETINLKKSFEHRNGTIELFNNVNLKQKKYTIHPELLDKAGNITEEELLTVRFSNDNDSPIEEKGSTTD